MSMFIDKSDYNASVHAEIIDSVIRSDESLLDICENRAVEEMTSYLSGRYDCNALFAMRGDERPQLVLMMALDIAIYHIFCIHNPMKLSKMRESRYERAVEWLKAVQKGHISIPGIPLANADDPEANRTPFVVKSNPKRNNYR
jgi:phage gp36-like protein